MKKEFTHVVGDYTKQVYHLNVNTLNNTQRYHITELIIKDSQNKVYHNGVKETFTQVRSQYWITKGRQTVKKIIGTCITCKRLEGISYQSPPMIE